MCMKNTGEFGGTPDNRTIPSQIRKHNPKPCRVCGFTFQPTGRGALYCSIHAPLKLKETQRRGQLLAQARRGVQVGSGSGSQTPKGKDNPMYVHGRCSFQNIARKRITLGQGCERCGKQFLGENRSNWAGHHKDHDQSHNTADNLEILCKQCHHQEHLSDILKGVTTRTKVRRGRETSKCL